MSIETVLEPAGRGSQLHRSLSGLCHLIRWAALGWLAWAVGRLVLFWGDKPSFVDNFGRHIQTDLSALPNANYAAALGVVALDVVATSLVVVCIWHLFGRYLRGEIFTLGAAESLHRLGLAGLAAIAIDIVARPLIGYLLTMHLGAGKAVFHAWVDPNDMLHLLMALFIVTLAQIHKTGVAIADENRQIV